MFNHRIKTVAISGKEVILDYSNVEKYFGIESGRQCIMEDGSEAIAVGICEKGNLWFASQEDNFKVSHISSVRDYDSLIKADIKPGKHTYNIRTLIAILPKGTKIIDSLSDEPTQSNLASASLSCRTNHFSRTSYSSRRKLQLAGLTRKQTRKAIEVMVALWDGNRFLLNNLSDKEKEDVEIYEREFKKRRLNSNWEGREKTGEEILMTISTILGNRK